MTRTLDQTGTTQLGITYSKILNRVLLGMVIVSSLIGGYLYCDFYRRTSEVNPIKQWSAIGRWTLMNERIFGKGGIADTNNDGILTFEERAKAYRLAGKTNFFVEGETQFDNLNINELEKIIDAYKNSH